jgi:hypothetical protein
MITTQQTLARPAPLARAVRTVDRWGLVAGVTGLLANVLLVVLRLSGHVPDLVQVRSRTQSNISAVG